MIEFDEFKKLSTDQKIKYLDTVTADRNTPVWYERLETAWETKSPLVLLPWDWLKEVYWEMIEYNRNNVHSR